MATSALGPGPSLASATPDVLDSLVVPIQVDEHHDADQSGRHGSSLGASSTAQKPLSSPSTSNTLPLSTSSTDHIQPSSHSAQTSPAAASATSHITPAAHFLRTRQSRLEQLGLKSHGLPLRFKDLSVYSSQIDHQLIDTLPSVLLRLTARPLALLRNLLKIPCPSSYFNPHNHLLQPPKIPILSRLNGVLNQGELLLVLGRPGSGMTTLLRTLSLNHDGFSAVEGHLDFGSMLPQTLIDNGLRPQLIMVEESDDHFGSLTASQTLSLAAACRTPNTLPDDANRVEWIASEVQAWASILQISPSTLQTPFGSAVLRGISGGERKRVSVIEGLLTRPSVLCLDNATAGLDSRNSHQLVQALIHWANIEQASGLVGLRQLSDQLYHLFHKVCLLYDGRQIFFGPVHAALHYFEELGFERAPNQPVADFLCSVTDPATRKLRADAPPDVPRTPAEFVATFERSKAAAGMWAEMHAYDARYPASGAAAGVLAGARAEKDQSLSAKSPWTISYVRQLACLTGRQYALMRADLRPFVTKTTINLLLSLIIGSLFANLPQTTAAAFSRGSVLFMSVLFNGYLQLSELGNTLVGRPVVRRHGRFGMYSASALALARTVGDGPIIAAQTIVFASITYGMAGLQREAGRFLRYLLLVYATAINLTAVFRMFAVLKGSSFDIAMRYCGVALNVFVVYGGYFIKTLDMSAGTRWIRYYVDPVAYAFEAVLSNEFHGLELQCSPEHIVPRGPTYRDPTYQTCSSKGSRPHELFVRGDAYVSESYGFEYRHLWRNLGVIVTLSVVVLGLSVLFTELGRDSRVESVRLFRNCPAARRKLKALESERTRDGTMLEQGPIGHVAHVQRGGPPAGTRPECTDEPFDAAVLTFRELRMSVVCGQQASGRKVVLDNLTGYVRPGEFTALMGESGAGKTTLLNVLAGRTGGSYAGQQTVSGEVLVDGRAPTSETYKAIGYVQQIDSHDEQATVREALEFSAVLRQPKSVPKWAKLADVDRVIDLLGLAGLEDAIVGTPAAGLGLEDRKKLSIGVELVARPRLLCLDEPISGMDSRSAMHIVALLHRLVLQTNLGVLVTVHQPSAEMMSSFDRLILLERGGRMAFFGPREEALGYFEGRCERKCRLTEEPGEYLIEMVSGTQPSEEDGTQDGRGMGRARIESILIDGEPVSAWERGPGHAAVVEKITALNDPVATLGGKDEARGATVREEVGALTKRLARAFWRDSAFGFTQLFTATAVGLIIGLSFFRQAAGPTTSLGGLQGQVFSVFLVLFVPPVLMNQLIVKWFKIKSVYEARERECGMYGEVSLAVAFLGAESMWCLGAGGVFWAIWIWGVGFTPGLELVGFTFVAVEMFFLFQATWAIWIAALAPTIGIVANILPFFLISMECFNGSLITYDQMPRYWRWMYWLSPFQWYVKAMVSMVLHGQEVRCEDGEVVKFESPVGMSCESFASAFLDSNPGYLVSLGDDEQARCGYCAYSSGDEFVRDRFRAGFEDRYVALGTFSVYCLVNVALILAIAGWKQRRRGERGNRSGGSDRLGSSWSWSWWWWWGVGRKRAGRIRI